MNLINVISKISLSLDMASKPSLERVSCLNFLSLHFLIYKMEITIIKLDYGERSQTRACYCIISMWPYWKEKKKKTLGINQMGGCQWLTVQIECWLERDTNKMCMGGDLFVVYPNFCGGYTTVYICEAVSWIFLYVNYNSTNLIFF